MDVRYSAAVGWTVGRAGFGWCIGLSLRSSVGRGLGGSVRCRVCGAIGRGITTGSIRLAGRIRLARRIGFPRAVSK